MYLSNNFKNIIAKYMVGFDIIYWINLDRMEDRKKKMTDDMLKYIMVPNIRISAIDGTNENDNMIYGKFNASEFKNSKKEYACLLSHLNTIKQFSESNYKIALILEDGICFDFIKYWNKPIETIISEAPADWDIITLNYSDQDYNIKDTYTLRLPNKRIWGAVSYIINIKAAQKLINNIYKNNIYILNNKSLHVSDDFIFTNLNTYVYKYAYFIWPDDNISSITEETPEIGHINFLKERKNDLIKTWEEYYKNNETFVNIPIIDKITRDGVLQTMILLFILYCIVIFIHPYINF